MQSLPLSPGANIWLIRLLTLLLAALAAGSALYWVLQWPAAAPTARPALASAEPAPVEVDKIALLLGAHAPNSQSSAPAAASPQTAMNLLGVIAQGGAGAHGSALIAVEGRPAKPFRVGEVVADGLVLHSVKARAAHLASSTAAPVAVTLALPALK